MGERVCPHCGGYLDAAVEGPLRQGESSYDPWTGEFSYRGVVIPLSPPAQKLVAALMRRRGYCVTANQLDVELGYSQGARHSCLKIAVCRARARLASFGADQCIGTVRGKGYRWVA